MHVTVLRHGKVELERCRSCCSLYHCPFCAAAVYKPRPELYAVKNHISNHLSLAVKHEEFVIVKCNLQCRENAHFHCCYCPKTIIRKVQLVNHLVLCKNSQVLPTEPAAVDPSAVSESAATAAPCLPAALTRHAVAVPVALTLHSVAVPAALTPHAVAVPAALTPHAVAVPAALTPHAVAVPAALTPHAVAVPAALTPHAVAKDVPAPVKSHTRETLQAPKRVLCHDCGVIINKKNLNVHIKRKHTVKSRDITEDRHLPSQCIDSASGVYAVERSFHRPCAVIHVQKNTSGSHPVFTCEMDECILQFSTQSGSQHFSTECEHLKSLRFCRWPNTTAVDLDEEVLTDTAVFGEQTKTACVAAKAAADVAGVPLSVELSIGSPPTKKILSVYEPTVSRHSRLGRIMVSYDSARDVWLCPCTKSKASCLHRDIARWHLFQTHGPSFVSPAADEHTRQDGAAREYPPSGEGLKQMVRYLMTNKTLPAELPQMYTSAMMIADVPKRLVPKETVCSQCPGGAALSEPVLITSNGTLLTHTGVVEGLSTYYRSCTNCGLKYRYQEWTDGIHNFDDHLLISLHMCITLRRSLQTRRATSGDAEDSETTTQQKLPSKDKILKAYMHFEALTHHEFTYSCVKCGYHPAAVMDLHKKASSNTSACAGPAPYDGLVTVKDFWESVNAEIVCQGLLNSSLENPFLVSPSYNYWAPWIGPHTRTDTASSTELRSDNAILTANMLSV